MAGKGDLEFVAATVSDIRRTLKAANDAANFQLAELSKNIEASGSVAAIEALTKAVEALKMPDVQFTAPTIAPVFNVPAPEMPKLPPITLAPESVAALASALGNANFNFEANMPQGQAPTTIFNAPRIASWELRIKGQYGASDRVMTITPTYSKD